MLFCAISCAADSAFTLYNSSDLPPRAIAVENLTLWIGYDDALIKYSLTDSTSKRFTVKEGLIHNSINAIAIDGLGRKWIGTDSGISIFDEKSWQHYSLADSIGNNAVRAVLFGKNNTVWAGTGRGLYALNGSTWSRIQTTHSITSLALDSTGNVWAGTIGEGVWHYNGQFWERDTAVWGLDTVWNEVGTFTLIPGIAATSLSSDTVFNILADKDGTVWFATAHGISSYKDATWHNLKERSAPSRAVAYYALSMDKTGAKWFGSILGLWVLCDTTWTLFNGSNGLTPKEGMDLPLRAVACESNGNIWVGTGSVLSKYDGQTWSWHTVSDGLRHSYVSAMAVAGDTSIWLATNHGAVVFDGKKWRRYTSSDGLPSYSCVNDIAIDSKGNKWLACQNGLCVFDGNRFTVYDSINHEAVSNVFSLAIDSMDRVWCSSVLFPIGMFDGKDWLSYQNSLWTTERGYMRDIAVSPQGKVWAVYSGGGVFAFEGNQWNQIVVPGGAVSNNSNSLFFELAGKLWIAHNLGVSSYQDLSWVHYSCMPEFFPADQIRYKIDIGCDYIGYENVLKDVDGRLWCGSNSTGVTMFDGNAWKQYDTTNGLPSSMVVSLAQDSDKNIWVGTINGAVKINPGNLMTSVKKNRDFAPPKPVVTFKQNNSRISISLGGIKEKEMQLELYSMSGRLLFMQKAVFKNGTYTSPRFSHGAYILNVKMQDRTYSQRIIVID